MDCDGFAMNFGSIAELKPGCYGIETAIRETGTMERSSRSRQAVVWSGPSEPPEKRFLRLQSRAESAVEANHSDAGRDEAPPRELSEIIYRKICERLARRPD